MVRNVIKSVSELSTYILRHLLQHVLFELALPVLLHLLFLLERCLVVLYPVPQLAHVFVVALLVTLQLSLVSL